MREGSHPRVRPVFLDRSGRRRRVAVLLGAGLATALVTGLGVLVLALSGASAVDPPGFPDAGQREVVPDAPAAEETPEVTAPPGPRPTAAPRTGLPGSPTPAATTADRPGNRRNPSRTPPHPKSTKNR